MTDGTEPAWIDAALEAAAKALERRMPCMDPGDTMPTCEWQAITKAALRAFMEKVPLSKNHTAINSNTLLLLKSTFTQP